MSTQCDIKFRPNQLRLESFTPFLFEYSELSSEDRQPYHLKYRSDSPHIIEFEKNIKESSLG